MDMGPPPLQGTVSAAAVSLSLPSSPFDLCAAPTAADGSGDAILKDSSGKGSHGAGAAIELTASGSRSGLELAAVPGDPRQQQRAFGISPRASLEIFRDSDTVTQPGKAPWWEVAVHLITVMFGAGVLGLPYALASLGWVLGVLMLALATGASCYSAFLLADLHTLRDGRRVRTLRAVGEAVYGKWGRRTIVTLQSCIMVTICLVFTVAGGTSILDIVHGCYGDKGAACDSHEYATWPWSLAFGGAMILLSQFPDFHSLTIVSVIGSLMPILYASIALVCILVHGKAEDVDYSIVDAGSSFKTVMRMFSAIGTMAFAYGGQIVQNEVAATVATPPAVIVSMRRALAVAYAVIGVYYLAVSVAGYAMFGNRVTGNVLQSVPYQVPAIIANVAVLIHVGAAYQAITMPLYHLMEEKAAQRKWLPAALARRPRVFRIVIRTLYVCLITFLACLIPFFTQLAGLVGGLGLGPLCFIAPVLFWQKYNQDVVSTARTAFNWAMIAIFVCISAVATVGSAYSIGASAASFKVFS